MMSESAITLPVLWDESLSVLAYASHHCVVFESHTRIFERFGSGPFSGSITRPLMFCSMKQEDVSKLGQV